MGKTPIVLFVAGYGIWFGLNLKQQLSEGERERKTQVAKRDTFSFLMQTPGVFGGTEDGRPI